VRSFFRGKECSFRVNPCRKGGWDGAGAGWVPKRDELRLGCPPRACPNDIGQPRREEGNHGGLPLRTDGDRLGLRIDDCRALLAMTCLRLLRGRQTTNGTNRTNEVGKRGRPNSCHWTPHGLKPILHRRSKAVEKQLSVSCPLRASASSAVRSLDSHPLFWGQASTSRG